MGIRRIALAVVAVAVAAGLAVGLALAFTGNGGPVPGQPASTADRTTAPAAVLVSPFTGERVNALNRVLAVKIDNIAQARPPTGLNRADIVYVLPVEGGLSRILAVFSSHFPPAVGPVRSAREDDMELLRQFGRPAYAYSGATPVLLPYIHRHARIADLYAGIASGYYRDSSRIAPYNLYAHTAKLLAQAGGASRAHGIGFRFGRAPAGGEPATVKTTAYPSASFTFTWSAARQRWLVTMDGRAASTAAGRRLGAATVVIQHTTVRTSRFLEYGKRPPYAESTGSGSATVLRNGKAYHAHWSRPGADGGTTFTTGSGQPMTFARGQVWVVLVR